MNRKALGRGLKALIPDSPPEPPRRPAAAAGGQAGHARLPLAELRPNPFQPRKEWPADELQTLADSLRLHGLLEPIVVRPAGEGHEIVAGERRVRAAQLIGWTHIDARIRPISDEEALQLALVENLQRKDLNPMEEARGYQGLIDHFGWTHERVAHEVGKSRVAVTNALRLIRLPGSIQRMVSRETLSAGHARALAGLSSPAMQERLAEEAIQKGLSVRQLERRVRLLARRLESRGSRAKNREGKEEFARLQDLMTRGLGLEVTLTGSRSRGSVRIRFASREELESLLSRLAIVVH